MTTEDTENTERDAETMSDGVKMLTNQSDSVAIYQKLCEAVYEIEGLRRELDALLAAEKATRNSIIEKGVQTERERNEARAERDILRLDAQREAEHHDRMVGELQRLYAKLEEARAIADELAAIAAHCLGSHSFALSDTAIKIADTLKRWEKAQ